MLHFEIMNLRYAIGLSAITLFFLLVSFIHLSSQESRVNIQDIHIEWPHAQLKQINETYQEIHNKWPLVQIKQFNQSFSILVHVLEQIEKQTETIKLMQRMMIERNSEQNDFINLISAMYEWLVQMESSFSNDPNFQATLESISRSISLLSKSQYKTSTRSAKTVTEAMDLIHKISGNIILNKVVTDENSWPTEKEAELSLLERKVVLKSRQTTTVPSFQFTVTDPQLDTDLSKDFMRDGQWEGGISHVFHRALKTCCKRDKDGIPGYVIDVGGNLGWYATLSAMHGCFVETFEPVPLFSDFLKYNLIQNKVEKQVHWYDLLLGSSRNESVALKIPASHTRVLWGAVGLHEMALGTVHPEQEAMTSLFRPMNTLDAVLVSTVIDKCSRQLARVCMLKADVEGFEAHVLKGASNLISTCKPEHIELEISPHYIARSPDREKDFQLARDQLSLLFPNYYLHHLPWSIAKRPVPLNEWNAKPLFETRKQFNNQTLLNWLDPVHPMDHNTNIWFSRKDLDELDFVN